MKTWAWVVAAAIAVCMGQARETPAALLLLNSAGKLIGADDVIVSGGGTYYGTYDVRFVDGTCVALFSGCNSLTDFPFPFPVGAFGAPVSTINSGAPSVLPITPAGFAMQALLDQVFIGIYDDQPQLTLGCGNVQQCLITIPVQIRPTNPNQISFAIAANFAPGFSSAPWDNAYDYVTTGGGAITNNFAANTSLGLNFVYATFTRVADAVPEPSSMLLLAAGAIALMGTRRRRR